jgi:hypothetical protein
VVRGSGSRLWRRLAGARGGEQLEQALGLERGVGVRHQRPQPVGELVGEPDLQDEWLLEIVAALRSRR